MAKKRVDPKLPIPEPGVDRAAVSDSYDDRLLRRLNELFRDMDDGTIAMFDEGIYIGQASGVNLIGSNVTAEQSATLPPGIYDITVTGGGSSSTAGVATLPSMQVIASENMSAGVYANVFNSSGNFRARKAKASAAGYEAFGWTDASVPADATATINFLGINTHNSGLTPGAAFLSSVAGEATSVCPSGAGKVAQQIGVAQNATDVAFEWQPAVLLAAAHDVTTGGSSTSVEVTTSTSIVINNAVSAANLTMTGAGGGGKSSTASSATAGGGGGSGEYCIDLPIPLTPGETVTVTIGAAGTGGTGGGSGGDGGTTTFACAAGTFSVLGGKGATSNTAAVGGGPRGGSAPSGINAGNLGTAETPVHFGGSAGGNGATAANNNGGPGAGAPGRLTGGAAGTGTANGGGGGGGAATIWGNGGAGGNGNAVGSDASTSAYGAGGGGAGGNNGSAQDGGDGAPGYVLITFVA